jgi:monoamine oxidase
MADANLLTPKRRLKPRLAAARDAFLRELDSTTLAEWSYPRNATAHAGFDHHVRSRTLDTPATQCRK